jgi:predicted ATPase
LHTTAPRQASPSKAAGYWLRTGEQAGARSTHVEAISHLRKGLKVLATLPDTPQRMQHELLFYVALGMSLVVVRGYADPDVQRVYMRSRDLCSEVGDTPRLFQVLRGLVMFYLVRGNTEAAQDLAEQMLRRAEHQPDAASRMLGHYSLGLVLFLRGVLEEAERHLRQAIAPYDGQQHRHHAYVFGIEICVTAQSHLACTLWLRGYPDQALAQNQEALMLARKVAHPFSQVGAQLWLAWVHQFRGEVQAAHDRATDSTTLAAQQGFALYVAWSALTQGWALTRHGQQVAGIAKMQLEFAAAAATGAEAWSPYFLAIIAEASEAAGESETGLRAIADAKELVVRTGQRFYEAELARLAGTLLLTNAPATQVQAEGEMRHAIDIARRRQAKSLELRATMSLACLWRAQGRHAEARDLLAPIYAWFTEGFDTADLKQAKLLLDDLEMCSGVGA